ncbi:cation:proton antiporter [Asticcacaulis solisilvae]|uniref:cation:proton antiporter n=1 Tax=Asticcacaulis solisilvae TaxID=1217274 RepID=UPI003FD87897
MFSSQAVTTPFDAAAILIAMAALLGYVNHRFLKLPAAVGMTVMGAVASLIVIGMDAILPGVRLSFILVRFLASVDFPNTLLNGMLCFLLFAGALHIDWREIKKSRWPILVLSTVSTLASTALVAAGFLLLSRLAGLGIPLAWCFVFGALISPTDPVAVFAVLKDIPVPPTLKATLSAESLFNDGVGVVLFGIALLAATGGADLTPIDALWDFAREAGGGIILGGVIGGAGYLLMRGIDDCNVEVMITLAVVMGGYSVAHRLGVSGPVAMAVAGLITGNAAVGHAMSATTRDYLLKFWTLIDEILNAVLFLLVGLESISVLNDPHLLLIGGLCIPLVLLVRFVSVFLPLKALPAIKPDRLTMATLVWGGLRGGLSMAMALSIGAGAVQNAILICTYVVVLFAVLVQGGTIGNVIKRLIPSQ